MTEIPLLWLSKKVSLLWLGGLNWTMWEYVALSSKVRASLSLKAGNHCRHTGKIYSAVEVKIVYHGLPCF